MVEKELIVNKTIIREATKELNILAAFHSADNPEMEVVFKALVDYGDVLVGDKEKFNLKLANGSELSFYRDSIIRNTEGLKTPEERVGSERYQVRGH